jgi:parallel beta-helix repeat protein
MSSCTCGCQSQQNTSPTPTSSNNAVVHTSLLTPINHDFNLDWLTSIFTYLGPTEKETVSFRCLCKLFSKALKPLPCCWTSFPHSKYSSLGVLFHRFTELHSSGSTNIPKVLLIDNGVHEIEDEYNGIHGILNMVKINIPISIIGESREQCIVMGGLEMNGKKEDDVNVSNLTLRDSKGQGVRGHQGASIHLDNVSVENSGSYGIAVYGSKRNTMKNCNVSHSKESGLKVVYGGLMTIDGDGTSIHHNCTDGHSRSYGLDTGIYLPGSIHLVSSLTIETISKNNGGSFLNYLFGGGNNYGGKGTIKIVSH